jgi:hypothetical protein
MRMKLIGQDWSFITPHADVNSDYDKLTAIICEQLDACLPVRRVAAGKPNINPWLTSCIINSCK